MANEKELTILLKIKDEASKALKDFDSNFGSLTNTLKYVGAGLAIVGGAAATFGVLSVKAAAEAQAEMAKFNTLIKNSKNPTDELKNKILEVANATVKLGFDDEETALSIARFYQRTSDLTQAMNLNNIAMDLSRDKNMSLTQAQTLVGLVLSGNGRALKQYGIDLKESATPMEAIIELQGKLKGSSEAYAKTYKGQMEILNMEFTNFKEIIGEKLLPLLTTFIQNYILPLTEKLMTLANKAGDLNKIVTDLHNVFSNFMNYLDSKLGVITILKTSWDNVVMVFKMELMPQLQKLYEALQPLMPFIQVFAQVIGVILYGAIIAVVKAIEFLVIGLTAGLTNAITVANNFIDTFKGYWDGLTSTISTVINYIDTLIEKIQKLNFIKSASNAISNLLGFGGGRAVGGSVSGGISYLVGERGPELFVPSSGGSIIPNNKLGGGITINITGNTLLDNRAAEKIGDIIVNKLGMTTKYAY